MRSPLQKKGGGRREKENASKPDNCDSHSSAHWLDQTGKEGKERVRVLQVQPELRQREREAYCTAPPPPSGRRVRRRDGACTHARARMHACTRA